MSKCSLAKPFTAMREMLARIEALEKNGGGSQTTFVQYVPPIGSIQIFADATHPATLYPGTEWEQLTDVFLYGAGGEKPLGAIGGEAEHTLTAAETPKVQGNLMFRLGPDNVNIAGASEVGCFGHVGKQGPVWRNAIGTSVSTETPTDVIAFNNGGQDQPHNNMPPYLAVNIWKRIS